MGFGLGLGLDVLGAPGGKRCQRGEAPAAAAAAARAAAEGASRRR